MEEYLGTILPFGFNFAPRGWAKCDGQIIPISQNTALFSLLGTTFGGDGMSTFGLPDLRGRVSRHIGHGPGLSNVYWGERDGYQNMIITESTMPAHGHILMDGLATVRTDTIIQTASNGDSNEPDSGNSSFGSGGTFPNIYSEPPASMDYVGGVQSQSAITGTTMAAGGNIRFNIQNPFLGVCICIAMQGLYPSRS